jgi:hypothetical protein
MWQGNDAPLFLCRESPYFAKFPVLFSWDYCCGVLTLGDWQRINVDALTPRHFIAGLMQVPMVAAAERYGELIADFEAQRPGLGKA